MAFKALKEDPAYLKAAFADLGLSEIEGKRHNARVVQLFKLAGHSEVKDDETAWCAAAVGGWLKEGGYPNTGSLMARSYAKYGVAYDLKKRIPRGAIVVWPRGAPPSGHVNICLEDDGTYLTCIGGNQGNGKGGGVTVSRELKSKAIAARIPLAVTMARPKVAVKPVPPPDIEPVDPEPTPEPEVQGNWFVRKWKALTTAVGGIGLGVFDPTALLYLLGFALVVIILIILIVGPSAVRTWLRKQFT